MVSLGIEKPECGGDPMKRDREYPTYEEDGFKASAPADSTSKRWRCSTNMRRRGGMSSALASWRCPPTAIRCEI